MDYDDDPDAYRDDTKVLSDSRHVARKPHECGGCECLRGGIRAGDRYRQVVMLDGNGTFEILRQCVTPGVDDPDVRYGYSLCQTCVAVRPVHYRMSEGYPETACEACGGDTCPCRSCEDTALMLLAGERDGAVLGMRQPRPVGPWTPERGTGPWQGPPALVPPVTGVPVTAHGMPMALPPDVSDDDIPW